MLLAAGKRIAARRARTPKPARKGLRSVPRVGLTVDERLALIAAEVFAGKHVDCAWELFRFQHFPDWPHEPIAAALGV